MKRIAPGISAVLSAILLCACNTGGGPPGGKAGGSESLDAVSLAISQATAQPSEALEITANPARVRIAVSDAKLAQADQTTRENAANSIVAAAEGAMSAAGSFASVQVISVAFVHPAEPGADTHVEDVLEFRRGPNGRFAHHIS